MSWQTGKEERETFNMKLIHKIKIDWTIYSHAHCTVNLLTILKLNKKLYNIHIYLSISPSNCITNLKDKNCTPLARPRHGLDKLGIIGCYEACNGYLTRTEPIVPPTPVSEGPIAYEEEEHKLILSSEYSDNAHLAEMWLRMRNLNVDQRKVFFSIV